MEKSSLETKLIAIKELKEQKYIGTSEAWQYLTEVANLYERIPQLAKEVNRGVSQRVQQIHYPATPERLLGLSRGYRLAIDELTNVLDEIEIAKDLRGNKGLDLRVSIDNDGLSIEDYVKTCQDPDLGLFLEGYYGENSLLEDKIYAFEKEITNASYCEDGKVMDRDWLKSLTGKLIDIFSFSQFPEMQDAKFGEIALGHFVEKYHNKDKIARIFSGLEIDWGLLMSKENMHSIERQICSQIYSSVFDVTQRVSRIKRDQIDHHLERKREVVSDFLSNRGINSYEEALQTAIDDLSPLEERIKLFKELNVPQEIKERQERNVAPLRDIYSMIKTEERFIRKILEN